MTPREREGLRYGCIECGKPCKPHEFHPHLFCVLVKAGIRHPDKALRELGYRRSRQP